EDYKELRAFIASHTPPGQKILPIVSSEWGYTLTKISPEQQAAYAVRAYLANLLSGVPLSIWYEWRDERPGAEDPEAHFGLTELDGKEKPAVASVRAILPHLQGAVIERRMESDKDDYLLLLKQSNGQHALLFWSAEVQQANKVQIAKESYLLT